MAMQELPESPRWQAEQEIGYLLRFVSRLSDIRTVSGAFEFAYAPANSRESLERRYHETLLRFLAGFVATGKRPAFCVDRKYRIVPKEATGAERLAYASLVEHFLNAGDINRADGEYVFDSLHRVPMRRRRLS